ncbi:serine hydrolase [Amycolatopsis jiangsuensis]|uniref:Beta-lactamase n=1 Tax=Amycolatopsis jiangsuensis TaxID=1181879 RepID=A0A840ITQ5_9PSEU|nr:serine hydrolase [Amycolatopsis jiangsuensis]MBB4685173.1 hypothetical protein [Amycolatopsis jiangsuensis]
MLTRRRLLTTVAATAPATLFLPGLAWAGDPDLTTEEGWLARLAAHREDVSAVVDDGAGHRFGHRAATPRPLASTVKVVHLLAYTTAVVSGRLDPDEQVRVGDWDARHPFLGDGPLGAGAHHTALTRLGIPCDEYGVAKDAGQRVPLAKIPEFMIQLSDNSAADYLRARLGDGALRAAAARGGWFAPDVRMFSGETLLLFFPEYGPPPGSPPALRRVAGDALSERFARDLLFRAEVLARILADPPTAEETRDWATRGGSGTATQLAGLHHEIATATDPAAALARGFLGAQFAGDRPPGTDAMLYKGGSLPGNLELGVDLVWPHRRPGTAVLQLVGSTPEDLQRADVLLRLCSDALAVPATLAKLEHALGH